MRIVIVAVALAAFEASARPAAGHDDEWKRTKGEQRGQTDRREGARKGRGDACVARV
jgi:hypothetical protein